MDKKMDKIVENQTIYLSISGIIAPLLFVILVLGLGMLEPGYNHLTQMMSILGGVGGLRGITFNGGVALIGILISACGVGFHKTMHGNSSRIGPVMIVLGGLGLIGSAIFHCNVDCTNVMSQTPGGIIHTGCAFIAGMNLAVSPFFIFLRIQKDPAWKDYRWFTLAMGIFANIPGVILWVSFFTTRIPEIEGLIQRLGIIFPLLWIGVMSYKMLQLSRKK